MGKAIVGIITTVIGIGLLFVPGMQAAGIGLIVSGVTSIGLALLTPSPKPNTTESAIKEPRPPRVSAYGESRLYGAYILYEQAEGQAACDVWAVHEGQLSAVVERYLSDDRITLVGNTVQEGDDGRYRDGKLLFYNTDGSSPGVPFSAVIERVPNIWTANHRGDGVVLVALVCRAVDDDKYLETYPSGVPQASIAAKWQKCPDPHAADPTNESLWTYTENAIRHLMHYKMVREGVDYATKIAPAIDLWRSASDICDEAIPITGMQTVSVDKAPNGTKAVRVRSVDGLKVGMTITLKDVDNTAHIETKVVTAIDGLTIKFGVNLTYYYDIGSEISWTSSAGYPLTEPRWRSCVAHKHTDKHGAVTAAFLEACDGWIASRSDGALVVYAGRYYEPTVTIGADEIIAYEWTGVGVDDDQAVNEITCSYVSKNHDYSTVECTSWRNEDDILERAEILSDEFSPQVPSHGQVRRLAKRRMARTNALYRGKITTNIAGRKVRGERYIRLTIEEAGTTFFDGVAEVTYVERNVSTGGVTFSWVAAEASIDSWNPATEEGKPAPIGNRAAQLALGTPVITSATPIISAGGSTAQVSIETPGRDRDDLTWYTRWKEHSGTAWVETEYTGNEDVDPIVLYTPTVATNSSIDVAIAYKVGDGRSSEWSATTTVSTSTAGLAPSANTGFTAAGDVGQITGGWSNSTSSNFGHSELWIGATSSFTSASKSGSSFTRGAGLSETFTRTLAAGTYYAWTLAYNTGNSAYSRTGPIALTVT